MWDGLFMLLTLSTVMAIASFLAGILPLSFTLSPRQLRFITLLGTGVLVGTALIVIIPEGIETMYSAAGKGHAHGTRDVQLPSISGQQKDLKHPGQFPSIERSEASEFLPLERSEAVDTSFVRGGAVKAPAAIIVERTPEDKPKQEGKKADEDEPKPQKGGDDDSTEGHKEGHNRIHAPEGQGNDGGPDEERDPHAYVGVALALGFILMFLVDHLPATLASAKPKYQPLHISLSDLSRGPHNSSTATLTSSPPPGPEPTPPSRSSSTTIGLIIHACADGIALGASSTAPSTALSLIIFLAIMLHKAPAAFGLTSVLLKQGLSKRTARTHLIFFSLAAPAGAVATWAIVNFLGRTRLGGEDGLAFTTGWILLFSGGTFLYVAMHSMTEMTSPSLSHDDPTANGYITSSSRGEKSALSKSDIATATVGMLVPLVTQVGHVH
ncbi:Zinc/iron permease [Lindgomyces ingoldianus]|uniref:Zinc/iron permease n=1 Tax=Lindgomyces ingoldianus TaxID=673940 RepID=A0ACB6RDT3_9PLEO|nr:Zinc/iron permease [Lindgomyces ingoldianus]KAF2477404.1 Zinc/iron permease [Lindgomyces ingoldianus]